MNTWCPFLILLVLYSLSRTLFVFILNSPFNFFFFPSFDFALLFHRLICFFNPLPLTIPLLSTLRHPLLIDTVTTEPLLLTS